MGGPGGGEGGLYTILLKGVGINQGPLNETLCMKY